MDFAINYSPEAAGLLGAGQIELDFFKTPPWPDMIAQADRLRPVRVHFNLHAGNPQLAQTDWGLIEDLLANTATQFVNIHLLVKGKELPHIAIDHPPSDAEMRAVAARMLENVQILCDRFGPERVIAENIPYRVGQGQDLRACVEPWVIQQVVEASGCGLLLDISHARIAARALGLDEKAYIQALPVGQLRELHFTGIHDWNGFWMDHLPILAHDWPWLEWVMAQNGSAGWGEAEMLAFEYGGTGEFFSRFSDPQVMKTQVPQLYAACHVQG
ncbi:MAG: DUF692 family protein [Anaerolineales bacterium]|nr:DUF692 family protein [Anaerolineales bacterium]